MRARRATSSPKQKAKAITSPSAARYQPGLRSRLPQVAGGSGGAWYWLGRSAIIDMATSLDLRRAAALLGEPGVELGLGDDVDGGAHQGVTVATELGADHRVLAELLGGHLDMRGDPRHRVDLHAEGGDPEVVDGVGGLDVELDLAPERDVELVGGDRLAPGPLGIRVGPGELLALDLDLHLTRLVLLDRVQRRVGVGAQRHQHDGRQRRPEDLEAGGARGGRARP